MRSSVFCVFLTVRSVANVFLSFSTYLSFRVFESSAQVLHFVSPASALASRNVFYRLQNPRTRAVGMHWCFCSPWVLLVWIYRKFQNVSSQRPYHRAYENSCRQLLLRLLCRILLCLYKRSCCRKVGTSVNESNLSSELHFCRWSTYVIARKRFCKVHLPLTASQIRMGFPYFLSNSFSRRVVSGQKIITRLFQNRWFAHAFSIVRFLLLFALWSDN